MASSKAKELTTNTTISSIRAISKIICSMGKVRPAMPMATVMLGDGRMACFMEKGRIHLHQRTGIRRVRKERELKSIQVDIMKGLNMARGSILMPRIGSLRVCGSLVRGKVRGKYMRRTKSLSGTGIMTDPSRKVSSDSKKSTLCVFYLC
jgi:hypothetical protein